LTSESAAAQRRGAGGFSFIEIMVVVVIIGLLAGAVAINVSSYADKAKRNRAKSDVAVIVNAIEAYYAESGRYPTNDEGLSALPLKNTNDPWGRPYQYNQPGRDGPYEVVTYGADGREGGTGADADIGSWNLQE
jgi:general secretion pathway protein G